MDAQKLVAHRGDNTNYPENSTAAIKAALKAGALFIEFDIQMNANHTLVVLHDSDFKRTANLNLSVFDLKNEQISSISIHEPERFAKKHYPAPLATLREIMTLVSQFPEVTAFVEVKEESLDYFGLKVMMDTLFKELKTMASQAVVISFAIDAIEYTQKHSGLKTGWVFEKYDENHHQLALTLNPEFLFCNYKKIPGEELWEGNWKWAVYTINEIELAQQMLEKNIALIETNDIHLLLNAD